MAIVRMLTSLSGPNYSRSPGDLHECSDGEAERLIAAGYAEPEVGKLPTRRERAVKVQPGAEKRSVASRVKKAPGLDTQG